MKLFDISGKIDNYRLEIIASVKEACDELRIPFFIVGATARDIILEYIYNIKVHRATNDIDFGIMIDNWNTFNALTSFLLKNKKYSLDKLIEHRLLFEKSYPLDIVPFGKISSSDGTFKWPKENNKFTVIGFEEAYNNSKIVKVQNNPDLIINFATAESLCLLKIISWSERYPDRSKDAIDIVFLIESYINAGNLERLMDKELDLVDKDFDYVLAGARLLGRDISANFNKRSLEFVLKILDNETGVQRRYRLVEDMRQSKIIKEDLDFDYYLDIIEKLKTGIKERMNI